MVNPAIPDRTEAADYYFRYIDQAGAGDIRQILAAQLSENLVFLQTISEDKSTHRYAPGKWSVRQVLNHVTDTERVFLFRAFWFARGFSSPLPDFDENIAAAAMNSDVRSWQSHVEEFRVVREGTSAFFRSLSDEAWARRGVASGNSFTVRALAFITAGHVAHHMKVLRERYLSNKP